MTKLAPPTDIIWLQTAFLGDIILTTAAFAAAAKAFPGVRQHLITTGIGAAALAGEAILSSRVVLEKKGKGLFSTLAAFKTVRDGLRAALPRGARPILLQPHKSARSSLLSRYLGFDTVTYRETQLSGHAIRRVTRVAMLHEAARISLLLEPFGVDRRCLVDARPLLTPLSLVADGAWQDVLIKTRGPIVAMAPGSVWGTKRWTEEGFIELGKRLLGTDIGLIVLTGSAAEAPLTGRIASALGCPTRVIDLAGKSSLDDLRRLYPCLDLLVSNDSSAVHYASSFNVPTVVVFGATVPSMGFGPLADRSTTVGVKLVCRPCSDHGPQVCPLGHFKCMKELTAATVFAECVKLLGV